MRYEFKKQPKNRKRNFLIGLAICGLAGVIAGNSRKVNINEPRALNPNNSIERVVDAEISEVRESNEASEPGDYKVRYPNPKYDKDDNFASDTEEMTFARGVYGEGRGELSNEDYIYGYAQTVKNRASIKNKNVKEILLENKLKKVKDKNGKEKEIRVWQYSCFSPRDVNYKKLKDPIKFSGEDIWRKCYDFSRKMLDKDCKPKNEVQEKLRTATNYWVDIASPPSWAYKDNDRKKGLREPLAVVSVNKGENKAYFYSFKHP